MAKSESITDGPTDQATDGHTVRALYSCFVATIRRYLENFLCFAIHLFYFCFSFTIASIAFLLLVRL